MNKPSLKEFCHANNLENIVNKPTCFKNPKSLSCINFILTSKTGNVAKSDSVVGYMTYL